MILRRRLGRRSGLTLLEVVLAVLIFMMSLTAIVQLLNISSSRALDVQLQAKGSLYCQTKLAEVIVGAEPLSGGGGGGYAAHPDDPDWQWRMETAQSEVDGLWQVKIWVKRDRADGITTTAFISQLVMDPTRRGSTLDVAPSSSGPSTTPSDTSGTTSGTTTGGTTP